MKWMLPCVGVLLTFASRGEAYYPGGADQPRVCRAVVSKGMLELRYFRGSAPVVFPAKGTDTNEKGLPFEFTFNITRQHFVEQQLVIDAAHIGVFGTDGKPIADKDVLPLLAKETAVMACSKMPDPDLLKILKKGTLILIVPASLDWYGSHGGTVVVESQPAPVPLPPIKPKEPPLPVKPKEPPPVEKTIPPKGT